MLLPNYNIDEAVSIRIPSIGSLSDLFDLLHTDLLDPFDLLYPERVDAAPELLDTLFRPLQDKDGIAHLYPIIFDPLDNGPSL